MKIEIKNIAKSYKKKEVLKDISLCAESGQCVGILGGNGCGKSTLLSILAGVLKADKGDFICDGKSLFADAKLRNRVVGYVPQGTPLIDELTAYDNLLLWYSKKDLEKELESGVLSLLSIKEFLHTRVSRMSGGMKKRLSIGCAMAKHPPVLLLDEASAALDLECKEKIAEYLTKYKGAGGILFLTTHDSMELSLCDKWYIIKDGILKPFEYDGNIRKLSESL